MDEYYSGNLGQKSWFYLLRGVLIFIAVYILRSITLFNVRNVYLGSGVQMEELPVWAVNLISAVILGFIYNSVVTLASMHDKYAAEDFFLEGREDVYFSEDIRIILKNKKFWLETATVTVISTVASFTGLFSEISYALPSAVTDALPVWLLPLAYTFLVFFPISLLCKYEARRYWYDLKLKKETDSIGKAHKIVFRAVVLSIIYPTVFPYAPMLVLASFSVFFIIAKAAKIFTVIGLILLVALFCLGIIALFYLKAINKRKKFIRSLLKISEENGYIVSEIYHPYADFFKRTEGYSFLLTKDSRRFACRFVSTVRKKIPVVFTSAEDGYYRHRIGSKNHHITLQHKFKYAFECDSEYTKILIVHPFPKQIIAESDGGSRQLKSGDKIWGYIVYTPEDVLGAIDRDCLGRYNGRYD
jgi:hypothetical protein